MPQIPKPKNEPAVADIPDDTWEQDQKLRGYYYDDSHGYERFDPEAEDGSEDEVPEGESRKEKGGDQ